MTIGERIRLKRTKLNLTLEEVASLVGISRQTLSRYENSIITNIPSDKIESLARILRTTPAYFMGWDTASTAVDVFTLPGVKPLPATVKKPHLGTIACGEPILAVENIDYYDDVPVDVHCDYTLTCKGDSMINARIYDGDTVYIRKQDDVDDRQIAAVLIDDEVTLKRVFKLPDRLLLRPENPIYPDLEYKLSDGKDIRIIGLAVALKGAIK